MEEALMVFDFWEQEEHRCLEQMKKSKEALKKVICDLEKSSQELDIVEKNLALQKPSGAGISFGNPKNEKNQSESPNSKSVIP